MLKFCHALFALALVFFKPRSGSKIELWYGFGPAPSLPSLAAGSHRPTGFFSGSTLLKTSHTIWPDHYDLARSLSVRTIASYPEFGRR